MSDPVGFVVGAAVTAAGFGLSAVGLGVVGGPLAAVGIGMMTQGLWGLPDHQQSAQLNVTSNQRSLPIAYGRTVSGSLY